VSLEEMELQRPFSERFLRPAIERLGSLLSRSTPQKARQNLIGDRMAKKLTAHVAAVENAFVDRIAFG